MAPPKLWKLPQRFEWKGQKSWRELVLRPRSPIHAVRQQAVTERAIAHPADLHADKNLRDIIKRDVLVLHQSHYEFVVGGRCKVGSKAAQFLIDAFPQIDRWMGRHPARSKSVTSRPSRAPVTMLAPLAIPQSHVNKIAVNTVHGRLFEPSKDLFNDKIAGKKVVSIENSDDIAASEEESAIDGIVEAPIALASNGSFNGCGRAVCHSFRFITLEALSSGVRRGAVQNEMLDAYPLRKLLTVHGSASAQNCPLRVVAGGQNRQGRRQGRKKLGNADK